LIVLTILIGIIFAAKSVKKAQEVRRQGFFGAAMLPMRELEYTDIINVLKNLEKRFIIKSTKDNE